MLNKFLMRAAVTAAALSGLATATSAEEYHVLMMKYAFFPETSYLLPGDVVTFENISGETRAVLANNGTWQIDALADGASSSMTITEGMPAKYFSLVPGGEGDAVDAEGNVRVVGTMNFDGPPLATDD